MIDFNKLIDNYLIKEYKPKEIGRYYPSEVGGCIRKTWFSYKKPKQTDARLIKIFEAGNMLHEFITNVIKSEKNAEVELLQSEVPIKIETKDFIISGRIDNLVLIKLNGIQVLVEVKSAKSIPWNKKKEHEMQLQLYLHATKIKDGMILYIQKDNLDTRSFNVQYDEKIIEKILKRFELLHQTLINDKIPFAEAKACEEDLWMCRFCAWKEECEKT
jgi:hypothetical protein